MNLGDYRDKHGREAIPKLVKLTGWPYSQFYRAMNGDGKGGFSFKRCKELAELEPELDAVSLYNEWGENNKKRVAS